MQTNHITDRETAWQRSFKTRRWRPSADGPFSSGVNPREAHGRLYEHIIAASPLTVPLNTFHSWHAPALKAIASEYFV